MGNAVTESESNAKKPKPGTVGWIDLTTENASQVRDFYQAVIGWQSESVPVEDHEDYMITPAGGSEPFAGICHKKGPNAQWPEGWLLYIHVENIEASLESCVNLGGEKLTEIRVFEGSGKACVIRDPGGSTCALFEAA